MAWMEFITAFIAFFATHMVPTRPPIRARLVALAGPRAFTIAYSVLSLAALIWLVGAAGRAPYIALWPWAAWQVHLTHLTMLVACLVLSLSLGRANPLSFGGGGGVFQPERPGLVRWMRHPILMALVLWSGAHLLVNGALAHVILFGLFLGFALIGQRAIDRRKRRQMGQNWHDLNATRRTASDRLRVFTMREFMLRTCLGAVVFIGLLSLHPLLFGVSALP
ncbi:MAG: NnrU family protein [Pseudomonadota bacterium]